MFNSLNCFCKNINVFQYKERKWVNANGILKNVCSKIALHIVLFVIFVCVSDSCLNVPLGFLRNPENAWRLKSHFSLFAKPSGVVTSVTHYALKLNSAKIYRKCRSCLETLLDGESISIHRRGTGRHEKSSADFNLNFR